MIEKTKVLVIKSSPLAKEKSYSNALTDYFMDCYSKNHPQDEIIELDLNDITMTKINLNRHNFNNYFNENDSEAYIKQLQAVNKVVFASPMINFNVSPLAKAYLDHILVANKTFSYKYQKKDDAIGLLDHLKVQILTTQGAPLGWYPWGDHTAFLKGTWTFVGAQVVKPILIAGTKVEPASTLSLHLLIEQYQKEIKTAATNF